MRGFVCLLIRFYQLVISRPLHVLLGPLAGCRFTPSCSQYALDAVRAHGVARGGWLALKRIGRCHPWGGCGHDPVPPPRSRDRGGDPGASSLDKSAVRGRLPACSPETKEKGNAED